VEYAFGLLPVLTGVFPKKMAMAGQSGQIQFRQANTTACHALGLY